MGWCPFNKSDKSPVEISDSHCTQNGSKEKWKGGVKQFRLYAGNDWNGWKLDEMQTDTSIKIKVATIVQGTKQKK